MGGETTTDPMLHSPPITARFHPLLSFDWRKRLFRVAGIKFPDTSDSLLPVDSNYVVHRSVRIVFVQLSIPPPSRVLFRA